MRTASELKTDFLIEYYEGKVNLFQEMADEEKAHKANANTDFMKDHHDKFIFRYEAKVEAFTEVLRDLRELKEA